MEGLPEFAAWIPATWRTKNGPILFTLRTPFDWASNRPVTVTGCGIPVMCSELGGTSMA